MKAPFVTILLLQMALIALSYERYPAMIAGFRVTDDGAYIFLPYAGDKEPVVESVIDLRCCWDWTRPQQQAWIVGDYWCIRVAVSSNRCFYRAYRTQSPINELNGLVMPAKTNPATTRPSSTTNTYPFADGVWLREWG